MKDEETKSKEVVRFKIEPIDEITIIKTESNIFYTDLPIRFNNDILLVVENYIQESVFKNITIAVIKNTVMNGCRFSVRLWFTYVPKKHTVLNCYYFIVGIIYGFVHRDFKKNIPRNVKNKGVSKKIKSERINKEVFGLKELQAILEEIKSHE